MQNKQNIEADKDQSKAKQTKKENARRAREEAEIAAAHQMAHSILKFQPSAGSYELRHILQEKNLMNKKNETWLR